MASAQQTIGSGMATRRKKPKTPLPKPTQGLVGQPLKRVEDHRLLTGQGKFLGDIRLPGLSYATFVRSPYARARLKHLNSVAALSLPTTVAVFTANDLIGLGDMPTVEEAPEKYPTKRPVLVQDEVRYLGEAVALVISTDPYAAEDAAELVDVSYEPLEPVVDPVKAMLPDSPRVHEHIPNNIAYHLKTESGDVERAFSCSDGVLTLELENQRVSPTPLEPRGVAASYDPGSSNLTVWSTTQDPHSLRGILSAGLGLPEAKITVIAPDMGGAFGQKISVYPEDFAIAFAAIRLRRPVKWLESRRENLLVGTHGRGQVQRIELAHTNDGRVLGVKAKIVSDGGAYSTSGAFEIPELTCAMVTGVYDVQDVRTELYSVLTNKVPQDAYRGAGRPEACYLIERAINALAKKLRLDPLEVRRKNFIPSSKYPYRTASGYTYDSGDSHLALSTLLERSQVHSRLTELRKSFPDRLFGLGFSTWTEITSFGPDFPQTAAVSVTKEGEVLVAIGGHPHGQGHFTSMVQIVSDELGVDPGSISIAEGDTRLLPWSSLTAGSRSAALTGTAVLLSARKIKGKMSVIAAKLLKDNPSELVFERGQIYSMAKPERRIAFKEVASAAYLPSKLPEGLEPTLYEYTAYAPSNYAFPSGAHAAVVEIDPETGAVRPLEYYAVDDVGRVINPLLAEGQVHGGVAQGLGQALLEKVVYDRSGQLLNAGLGDYCLPSTTDMPRINWSRIETVTYANILGVKGIGEAGTIAATPALVNAVEDALGAAGGEPLGMPLLPELVWKSLSSKSRTATASSSAHEGDRASG